MLLLLLQCQHGLLLAVLMRAGLQCKAAAPAPAPAASRALAVGKRPILSAQSAKVTPH